MCLATGHELMNRVGSRLAPVNLRAAAAGPGTSTSFSKHCVFIKLADLSAAYVDELVNERGAGAVVVLVPVPNPESPPSLPVSARSFVHGLMLDRTGKHESET